MASPLVVSLGLTDNTVRVHPVVLFSICDAYIRRNEGQKRVIGALLGTVADGVVEVKTAYAVPHSEQDDHVAVDNQHHTTMLSLQRKVDPRERMVGWFSSDAGAAPSDALLHSFFASTAEGQPLVLLKVDTTLGSGAVTSRAYVSRAVSVRGAELAREFIEAPCEVATAEAERVGLKLLGSEEVALGKAPVAGVDGAAEAGPEGAPAIPQAAPANEGLGGTLDALHATLEEAISTLDAARASGSGIDVARAIADAAASVPRLPDAELAALLASEQRDLLVSLYFAQLLRSHIAIADKLGTLSLPLL